MLNVGYPEDLLVEEATVVFHYTTFWPRVFAFLIDRVVMLIFSPLVFFNAVHWKNTLLYATVLIIQFSYKPVAEYMRGTTIGKSAFGMKVVNDQFQKADFKEIFLRNINIIIELVIALTLILYTYYSKLAPLKTENALSPTTYGVTYLVILLFNITDVVFLAVAKDGRSLHDRIAKTYVIKNVR